MRATLIVTLVIWLLMPVAAFSQVIYHADTTLLSVKADGRLLSDILSDIHAQTGIEIYINPRVDKPVFIKSRQQPLEEALKRLITPLNNIMIFDGDKLAAIKIFKNSHTEATLKIVVPGTHRESATTTDDESPETEIEAISRPGSDINDDIRPDELLEAIQEGTLTKEEFADILAGEGNRPLPPHLLLQAFHHHLITENQLREFLTPEDRSSPVPPPADGPDQNVQVDETSPIDTGQEERQARRPPHFIREDLEGGLITEDEFKAEMEKDWGYKPSSVIKDNSPEDEPSPVAATEEPDDDPLPPRRPPHLIRQDLEDGIISEDEFKAEMEKDWGRKPPPEPADDPDQTPPG